MNFELRKHTTNHNSFSVVRETNTNHTDNTNTSVSDLYSLNSSNLHSIKKHHESMVLFRGP